ncbi:MAG: hypothetical protein VKK03_02525 [Synechococcus sp.]|nr:hypothetical protein [Synechococcus sp.]
MAVALGCSAVDAVAVGMAGRGGALAQTQAAMQLSLRRQATSLQVVLEGVGENPVLQQRLNGAVWEGQLRTKGSPGLLRGPQTLTLRELGIEAVSLTGAGENYQVTVRPAPGQTLKDPVVSADGRNLILTFADLGTPRSQAAELNLNTPGRVLHPRSAPPLRPRAVAPPLGDMAVGTMVLQNRSYVNVSGPQVTLTLQNAPAKDALMSLARLGGYGFVYVGGGSAAQAGGGSQSPSPDGQGTVTMAFSNEDYGRALNSLLLASGLQAKLDGRTLLVGTTVSGKTFGPQVSKVYRLNQASAASAADYLASLGAQINKVNTTSITTGEAASTGTSQLSSQTSQKQSTETSIETYGASNGPLVGLTGTTDSRLQTITLVGESRLVAVAEGYLKQIDLRQRQVAVKVQILNINLLNDRSVDSSFSARLGNTFIVNESGRAFMNFGDFKPGSSEGTGVFDGSGYRVPGRYDEGNDSGAVVVTEGTNLSPAGNFSTSTVTEAKGENAFNYAEDSFYGFLQAAIESSSAKTLAQPTLLVQEGQEAEVVTGTNVITDVERTVTANGSTQFTYTRQNAGLTLKVKVSKIDDNGFVSLDLSPQVSVPIPAGRNEGVAVFNIAGRSLSSGAIRLRDRQTLVLTGVIQDEDREVVTKWPILGDLPLIGQLFRSSGSSREKNELVILVTPAIVDDEAGGSYGYGYRPSTPEARTLMTPR